MKHEITSFTLIDFSLNALSMRPKPDTGRILRFSLHHRQFRAEGMYLVAAALKDLNSV